VATCHVYDSAATQRRYGSCGRRRRSNTYLVKSLPRATVTLAQPLFMVKPPTAALSAKYEVGDRGRLSLSIYVAAHGVRDANRASLEEVSGDPLAAKWSPSTETLRNASDVSEATIQRRLLTATKLTLLKTRADNKNRSTRTGAQCRSRSVAASRTQAFKDSPARRALCRSSSAISR